jgi:hypothetical protein
MFGKRVDDFGKREKALIEREMKLIDAEIDAKKKLGELAFRKWEVDKSLESGTAAHDLKLNNWQIVDKARSERSETVIAIKSDIAKLEAQRDYDAKIANMKVEAFDALMKSKDDEIYRLTNLLSGAMIALGAKKVK